MALRKMTPGGYEYLTGNVACADHQPQPGESMADYYLAHGYPPGEWIGAGAKELGIAGEVTEAQMLALFGEGRHPRADEIMAERIAAGDTHAQALKATQLDRRFPQYGDEDALRRRVGEAYKQYNSDHNRPVGAPLNVETRQEIRDRVYADAFAEAHDGRNPRDATELQEWLADQKQSLRNATAGFELVFAPDKATSAAWALADPATSALIADAHRQAVRDSVALFERDVAFTRAGNYGEAQVDVQGVTAAMFEHWDSRTGDPHLHTHVPISTKVHHSDGQWTSLDGRTLHAAAVTVSEFSATYCSGAGMVWCRSAAASGRTGRVARGGHAAGRARRAVDHGTAPGGCRSGCGPAGAGARRAGGGASRSPPRRINASQDCRSSTGVAGRA